MLIRHIIVCALGAALASVVALAAAAESSSGLTLSKALQRALATNPRLTAAERDVGIAAGRRIQAGAIPNPEASFELNNAFGSGDFRGLRSAETTLQLSQLIELGGKREARVAAGSAELDAAHWERAAVRLESISDTAVAFFTVLGAQRRIQIYDIQIVALDRLTPLLQGRVEAGASRRRRLLGRRLQPISCVRTVSAQRRRWQSRGASWPSSWAPVRRTFPEPSVI